MTSDQNINHLSTRRLKRGYVRAMRKVWRMNVWTTRSERSYNETRLRLFREALTRRGITT